MGRVIVPLDGSSHNEAALPVAESLARALGVPIELVRVVPERGPRDRDDELLACARDYLDVIAGELPPELCAEVIVARGDPARRLLELAASRALEPPALLVMGTQGRAGIGRAVSGSVADRLARSAPIPVTLVRDPGRGSSPSQRLLVPLDGSALAERALPMALELARASDATVHLVRVVEPSRRLLAATVGAAAYVPPSDSAEIEQEMIDEARAYLDSIARQQRRAGARVAWEVRTGPAAPEILRAAATSGADLVIVSSHGRGGLQRLALGSVADVLVRTGPAPVMVIPRAAQIAQEPNERLPDHEREAVAS
ncbi:MAG TPA: universal stress protein [Thermomicrobiaceae bacterium]|nr:universal stress protein [Thermomicrobiaceae bacterium]